MRTAHAYEDELTVEAQDGAELNLGMGSLIGIFFGMALVCGVFFGFGYMMGHRSPGPYVSSEPLYQPPKAIVTAAAPKPSAQLPAQAGDASRVVVQNAATAELNSEAAPAVAAPTAAAIPQASRKPQPGLRSATIAPTLPPAAVAKPVAEQRETIMVQIAAVKSRADAEALATALQKNGFNPAIRSESQDKFLHVQVGPFANRDEAKAMRQKLSGAGYNAFIK